MDLNYSYANSTSCVLCLPRNDAACADVVRFVLFRRLCRRAVSSGRRRHVGAAAAGEAAGPPPDGRRGRALRRLSNDLRDAIRQYRVESEAEQAQQRLPTKA